MYLRTKNELSRSMYSKFRAGTRTQRHVFSSCDLDLKQMTWLCEFVLEILEMYLLIENEISRSVLSDVIALQTDTHRQILL